ncbi:ppsA, partial [Symbiodinium pilosum]
SQWQQAEPMEPEGNGTYTYVVVLGETRFEQFQIWLDGESHRVLHPGHAKGFKDTTVFGPDSMGHGCNWVIDGRQELPA